jgi:hypothetical protein
MNVSCLEFVQLLSIRLWLPGSKAAKSSKKPNAQIQGGMRDLLEVDQDSASRLRIAQEPAPRVASLAALLAASAAGFLSRP